jgi:hypothetical protein
MVAVLGQSLIKTGNVPAAIFEIISPNIHNCWIRTIFHIHCVGMFMIYMYTKLHIHNTSGSTPYHHNVTTYLFDIVVRESWI